MVRAYLAILILQLGLILPGCAVFEYFDGTSEKDMKQLKMTNAGMSDEIEKLRIENKNLKYHITILREENMAMRDQNVNKMENSGDETRLLQNKINKLQEQNEKVTKENQNLYEKIADLRLKCQIPSEKSPPHDELEERQGDIRKLKIKVLSGDGDINSAKNMAQKLRDRGYAVQLIGKAPRPTFVQHTIFFAPKFQGEAEQLVSHLGDHSISKPLTWESIFDLIVVTGKYSSGLFTDKQ